MARLSNRSTSANSQKRHPSSNLWSDKLSCKNYMVLWPSRNSQSRGPFGQSTPSNFGQPGVTDYRNPNLAEVMKNLGYVQRFGLGIAIAKKNLKRTATLNFTLMWILTKYLQSWNAVRRIKLAIPVIAFFNNKGGVGKTSLVYHIAWMLSELGWNVLAADLNPQANLTGAFWMKIV